MGLNIQVLQYFQSKSIKMKSFQKKRIWTQTVVLFHLPFPSSFTCWGHRSPGTPSALHHPLSWGSPGEYWLTFWLNSLRPHLGGTSFCPETRHTFTQGTGGTRAGPAQVLGFSSEARAPPRSSVPPGLCIFQAWCFPQPTPQQIHLA